MYSIKLLLLPAIFLAIFQEACGHGMVMDPVNRSSAWRKHFKVPVNWDDTELYCGGISVR